MLKSMLKFAVLGCCAIAMIASSPTSARAADFEVQTVFEDALYGGAIGALVGAGFLLISSQPSQHWDYITTGAGVGIVAGAAYGVVSSSRAFAQIEDGKMVVGVPTPRLSLQEASGSTTLALETDLMKMNF